jgi:hypothetical protein
MLIKRNVRVGSKVGFVSTAFVLIIMSCSPATVFADSSSGTSDPSTSSSTTPSSDSSTTPDTSSGSSSSSSSPDKSSTKGDKSSQTGPSQPTGPSADTYTYNSATGLWENQYYIWNPVTGQTTPITPQTYSYNPATGMWDTTQWVFDPTTGEYVPNVIAVATPPAGAPTTGSAPSDSTDNSTSGTSPSPDVTGANTSTTGTTGNGGTTDNQSDNSDGTFDNFYNASISNNLSSAAQTGNATVDGNTTGGDATSGDAVDVANVENLLQSSATGFSTFTTNVTGDVDGNILIDPTDAPQVAGSSEDMTNLNENNVTGNTINNNLALTATSGNADVTNNTTGGNATSGSADTVANLVNLIDSAISSGQSFLGVINIFGDLNGNILLPSDFLNTLLASNTGPSSSTTTTATGNTEASADTTNNAVINNNLTSNANTGQASVTNNTTGGNATTGTASSNVTVLNLTGSQVVSCNDVLVFVNVLGTWVGLIMDAPSGTTSAELAGGCATQDTTVPTAATTSANLDTTNNDTINNNITGNATTGNANVSNNTTGGNATTGNASTSANIANLIDSQLDLSNWFGILFINVFGTWDGSFGDAPVQTSAPQSSPATTPSTSQPTTSPTSRPTNEDSQVIDNALTNNTNPLPNAILASSASGNPESFNGGNDILVSSRNTLNTKNHRATSSLAPISLIVGLTGLVLLGSERIWTARHNRQQTVDKQ